jgi:hypothetical protein
MLRINFTPFLPFDLCSTQTAAKSKKGGPKAAPSRRVVPASHATSAESSSIPSQVQQHSEPRAHAQALLPNFQAIYRIVYAGHHRILPVARL